jgi:Leucine-rich repeat (LRR) protein
VDFGKLESLVELNLSGCDQLGCLPDSIVQLSQLKTFQLWGCHKLVNLSVEFGKLQSLVELNLSGCDQLRCLPDSIVHLSQLKTFRLWACHKLENLPMEFGKLQSLVQLDLSSCSQLRCLPDSIVHLSQLQTFQLSECHNLENLPMEFEKLESLVELDLSGCDQLGCLPDSIVHLSQLKLILTNLAQQPQKSVPPTPAVAPHSGQPKQTCKHSPQESNWLLSPIKTPENQYQTLDSVSGVHILAADSVYTRIDHKKSKLTTWEEV